MDRVGQRESLGNDFWRAQDEFVSPVPANRGGVVPAACALDRVAVARRAYVTTAKGRLAVDLQKKYGDVLINRPNGEIWAIELKAEQEEKYGNFFFEEWSNRSRNTPGWLRTLDADWLLYHFLRDASSSTGILYCIPFPDLKRWAYATPSRKYPQLLGRVNDYELRRQSKWDQRNDTWGYAVNIWEFASEVCCDSYLRSRRPLDPQRGTPQAERGTVCGVSGE